MKKSFKKNNISVGLAITVPAMAWRRTKWKPAQEPIS